METAAIFKHGGPGAILIAVYTSASILIWFPNFPNTGVIVSSVLVAVLIPYIIAMFNDELMSILYKGTIIEAKKKIEERTDDSDFYFGYPEQRHKLDEYDEKVFRNTVTIISGILIGATLIIQGLYYPGRISVIIGIGGSLVCFVVLIYKPYVHSRETIMTSVKLYD